MGGNSLDRELMELHNFSTETPPKSAFVQAENKILPEAIKQVLEKFSSLLHKPQHLNKHKLMAIDGTSLKIFRNPSDKAFVPNKTHKGHNALTLSATYDLLNHIYTDAVIESFNVNDERVALISMLSNVDINSIRKQMTEEERRKIELYRELPQVANIQSGDDINTMVKEMIAEMVGGTMVGKLESH